MMRYLTATALLIMLAIPAFSAGIDGKWTATIDGMDGNKTELTYNFKVEGTKLTGTVTSSAMTMQITDGKVEGNNISFTATSDQMSVPTKGTITSDEIKLVSDVMGTSTPISLKRAK
jgi:hypothetical protein